MREREGWLKVKEREAVERVRGEKLGLGKCF